MVMDFVGDQDRARGRTTKLVLLMIAGIVSLGLVLYAAIAGVLVAANPDPENPIGFWQPELLVATLGLTTVVVVLGSLFKVAQLSGGGKAVAEALGGTLVHPDSRDKDERRLLNVVEEMAIASGCPVPPVYIIQDQSINAFAAGFTVDSAVIGVTTGCVKRLSRDELQGVMAHEFSHIVHGDMRLNIRLTGLIFGIMVLGYIGWICTRFIGPIALRSGGGEKNPMAGIGLALIVGGLVLMILGSVGTLVARLIQAAVSRQREFLADAAAVDYTRNPDGIAGALRAIGGLPKNDLRKSAASEFEHFFFTPALATAFSTHPPLPLRIARIENRSPSEVSAEFTEMKREVGRRRVARLDQGLPPDPMPASPPVSSRTAAAPVAALDPSPPPSASPVIAGLAAGATSPNWRTRPATQVRESLSHLGDASVDHLAYARTLIATIPESVRDAAHDVVGARAICLLLLVSADADVRKRQATTLQSDLDEPTRNEVSRLSKTVRGLVSDSPETRLVLLDLVMPSLARMGDEDASMFLVTVDSMIDADGQQDRFEWLLGRLLQSHFASIMGRTRGAGAANRRMSMLSEEVRIVLAMIAWSGSRNATQAHRAFVAAARTAGVGDASFPDRSECSVTKLDRALDRLQRLRYKDRARLLDAAVEGVCSDGHTTIEEVELLRALAAAISCPMPPVLPSP